MIRTQISLEPEEVSWLKREAKARGKTMAGIIREMIDNALARDEAHAQKRPEHVNSAAIVKRRHPWVGICKDIPKTDATLAEDYLYGKAGDR